MSEETGRAYRHLPEEVDAFRLDNQVRLRLRERVRELKADAAFGGGLGDLFLQPPGHVEWLTRTARGGGHLRSFDLRAVDTANPDANFAKLKQVFATWRGRNPKEVAIRNADGVVDQLATFVANWRPLAA